MNLESVKTSFLGNKKYLLIYLISIAVFTFSMLGTKNYQYRGFEEISIPILIIIGIICIIYSFYREMNPEKVALILILVFGLMMVFLAPPMTHPDEVNHYTRAEALSEGEFFPQSDQGFYENDYFLRLNEAKRGLTIFDNHHVTDPITSHKSYINANTSPFYSYIASALGILLAKCLNLTSVFAMFFARLANLLVFAGGAYWAIKKSPAFKIGLTVLATMPLTISQASSVSYDAFILTLTMIILCCFIKMYKDNVENKYLAIFFISILLISLIKPPYVLFALLMLVIPKENYSKNRKYSIIGIVLVFIATLFSFGDFITPLLGSNVQTAVETSNVSSSGQISYLINNPMVIIHVIKESIALSPSIFIFDLNIFHYADFKGLKFFNICYFIFFLAYSIFYRFDINFSKINRAILSAIFILIFFGIYFILYIIWTPIGSYTILGVQARYFIPITALLPMIINYSKKSMAEYKYLITFVILFLSGLILLTITHYY
ncbi:Uncharacterized membrane protein [Methanobrevibacter millerae]|uniref:Uncharacterized membrane protein n=2 Tax=Methanobrevibacter millerae TaxID=230361 RepID=A0A1G5UTZ2_9EURY|nr:Uncharacterized membrane protein [Methanobrevibacter millerae]